MVRSTTVRLRCLDLSSGYSPYPPVLDSTEEYTFFVGTSYIIYQNENEASVTQQKQDPHFKKKVTE